MTDIFLSYAREDEAVARKFAKRLVHEGWDVFWDRDIPIGETWEDVLERNLAAAPCVIVLWSQASVKSRWVKLEAGEAADQQKLVPANVETSPLPLNFRGTQSADLTSWDGAASHDGFAKVLQAVRRLVPTPAPAKPSPTFTLNPSPAMAQPDSGQLAAASSTPTSDGSRAEGDSGKSLDRSFQPKISRSQGIRRQSIDASRQQVPLPERGQAFTVPLIRMKMLWVPGGVFDMGSDLHPDEQPIHKVQVSSFWIGETLVTNEQWAIFHKERGGDREPLFWRKSGFSDPSQPVVGLSVFDDIRVFSRACPEFR